MTKGAPDLTNETDFDIRRFVRYPFRPLLEKKIQFMYLLKKVIWLGID